MIWLVWIALMVAIPTIDGILTLWRIHRAAGPSEHAAEAPAADA